MKRWRKRLGLVALAVGGLTLSSALVGYLYLTGPAGTAQVRALGLAAVNDAVKGEVGLTGLTLSPRRIVLTGLTLDDPEGNRVAEVAQVELLLRLSSLSFENVALESVRITQPRLFLRKDERGLNLARALEGTQAAAGAGAPPSALRVVAETLAVEEGSVRFTWLTEEGARHVDVGEFAATGKFSFASPQNALVATLSGTAQAQGTTPLALRWSAEARMNGATGSGTVLLGLGEAELRARAEWEGTEESAATLERLLLPPEVARAFFTDYPLRVPLEANGTASRQGNTAVAKLEMKAGSARLLADGKLDVALLRADHLSLRLADVDLDELLGTGVKTHLSAQIDASGEGTLTFHAPASKVRGQTVGPVHLAARATQGRVEVTALEAALPGATLFGAGEATSRTMKMTSKLTATDLGALTHALGSLSLWERAGVRGHGSLELSAEGPLTRPSLTVSGTLPLLQSGDGEVRGLSLSAWVPDVRRPLEAQGTLEAKKVRVGERQLEDVRLSLLTRGRKLSADLSAKGLADLVMHAGGTVDEDGQGAQLSELDIRYPEAQWSLESPFILEWAGADVEVGRFTLRSEKQRLSFGLVKKGRRVSAGLTLEELSLARLPRAFVDPRLGLSGSVSLSAQAEGRLPRPALRLNASWTDGAVRGVGGIEASVLATYASEHLVGSVRARSSLAPETFSPQAPQLDGVLTLEGRIEGTTEKPRLALSLQGEELRWNGQPLSSKTNLTISTIDAGTLAARVDAQLWDGGTATATLDTPFTLAQLFEAPPTMERLRSTPLVVRLDAKDVELSHLSSLGLGETKLSGTLGLHAEAQGTLAKPEGTLDLSLAGARFGEMASTDLALQARAGHDETAATLTVRRQAQTLLRLDAHLGASPASLASKDALTSTPLRLEGWAGPLSIAEWKDVLAPHPGPLPDGEGGLSGSTRARIVASGTLGEPRLHLSASAQKLALGKVSLGDVELSYRYQKGQSALFAKATSTAGGVLTLKGDAELDLALPALRRGLTYDEAPFEATLAAERFDVRFLSGIHPKVRLLEGLFTAHAIARGTLADVDVQGSAEWKDGRVGLIGLGEYKKVHLLAEAKNGRIALKDFSAHSGGGRVELSGTAVKAKEGYTLEADGKLVRFPVVYDDQLMAIATTRLTAQGDANERRVQIRELAIPEAHIELPQLRHKDLQDLDRPADIVLVKNGQPLFRRPKQALPHTSQGVASTEGGAAASGPMQYWVTIAAPKNLWVKSDDIDVELGLSDGFRVEYAEAVLLFGEVDVMQGKVEVIGRRFEVVKPSQVRFAGPATAPSLHLTAVHHNEREGVTVTVAITGRAKEVSIKPSSQPPMPESEIYTLLATGRRTLKRGSGAAITGAQAVSVLGGYAASQLKAALGKKLPLDVVSVEAGDEGLAGTRWEAGVYLSPRLYVGYTGQYGADPAKGENSHAARLEYQISRAWSFEATAGDARAGGAELVWSQEY